MPGYLFYQLDVFTTTALRGNPLAVFPEPEGLTSRIHVDVAVGNGGAITEVRVGGAAVTVIEGEVRS